MSKYHNRVVLQMTEIPGAYFRISGDSFEWIGPVALCKGDDTAKQAEKNQMVFDQQLMTIFQAQYATQKSQLDYLNNKMRPIIDNGGTGYTPQQLAAMRTSVTDSNSKQFQNAQDALNNQLVQSGGGSKLSSVAGNKVEADAALLSASAAQQAQGQEAVTAQDAQLKQVNYWNAINALNGVASQTNPLGYASAATSGTNAVANASQAVTAANQSQILGALGGIAGGVGSALGGGFSKGGLFGCHIFASFFGWNDRRTKIMRLWIRFLAPSWFRNFYYAYSPRISKTPVRWVFRPLATYVLESL